MLTFDRNRNPILGERKRTFSLDITGSALPTGWNSAVVAPGTVTITDGTSGYGSVILGQSSSAVSKSVLTGPAVSTVGAKVVVIDFVGSIPSLSRAVYAQNFRWSLGLSTPDAAAWAANITAVGTGFQYGKVNASLSFDTNSTAPGRLHFLTRMSADVRDAAFSLSALPWMVNSKPTRQTHKIVADLVTGDVHIYWEGAYCDYIPGFLIRATLDAQALRPFVWLSIDNVNAISKFLRIDRYDTTLYY